MPLLSPDTETVLAAESSEAFSQERYQAAAAELAEVANQLELLEESLADLELAREDAGWTKIGQWGTEKFSREGLRRSAQLARVMVIANPLLKRGIALRTAYVWAAGVQIAARSTGPTDDNQAAQDVNAVIQTFLDDPETKRVLTGAKAHERNERTLGTDGTLHVALVTNPATGWVRPRLIPFDEIAQVVYNPEDRLERRFYLREFTQVVAEEGYSSRLRQRTETRRILYPSIDYRPGTKLADLGGVPIEWDAPIVELNVNELDTWDFGIGDLFAALPWARAYSDFLTDWSKLVKALSRFAFRATADRPGKAQKAAAAQRALGNGPSDLSLPGPNRSNAGATVHLGPGQNLEAIPKTGATIDSDSGRPIAAMVASGLDVSVVSLLGDPGVTGARATAETLDKPTENMATMRRDVWGEFFIRVLDYVIDMSAKAPGGALKRKSLTRDKNTGREVILLAGDTDRTIEISWPDLTETPTKDLVDAIVQADSTNKMPPIETLKLLLRALGVDEIDEIVESMTDEQGNFIDPEASAGDQAVKAFRNGEDPAGVV